MESLKLGFDETLVVLIVSLESGTGGAGPSKAMVDASIVVPSSDSTRAAGRARVVGTGDGLQLAAVF